MHIQERYPLFTTILALSLMGKLKLLPATEKRLLELENCCPFHKADTVVRKRKKDEVWTKLEL
jgi:hypothetical protein